MNDEFKVTPYVSGDEIISTLKGQIRRTKQEQDRKVVARIWELELLLPGCRQFVPQPKELRSEFLRNVVSILSEARDHERLTDVLWHVYETSSDFDIDDLEEFCRSCELSAAINMTTESWADFGEHMKQANNCQMCSCGYSLQGLSIATFGEPISIEAAKELSHLNDPEAFLSLYGVFMRALYDKAPEIEP